MAMIVTVLNAMWATIEGPRRPVRQARKPSTTPKPARPRNCSASKCARANTSAVRTIETAGAEARAELLEAAKKGAQEQAAEEQLLDDAGCRGRRAPRARRARPEGVAGEALGRDGRAACRGGARKAEAAPRQRGRAGTGRPRRRRSREGCPARAAASARSRARRSRCPGARLARACRRRRAPAELTIAAANLVATTAAPTKPTQSPNRLTTSSPYWLGCWPCGARRRRPTRPRKASTKPATMPNIASAKPKRVADRRRRRIRHGVLSSDVAASSRAPTATLHACERRRQEPCRSSPRARTRPAPNQTAGPGTLPATAPRTGLVPLPPTIGGVSRQPQDMRPGNGPGRTGPGRLLGLGPGLALGDRR